MSSEILASRLPSTVPRSQGLSLGARLALYGEGIRGGLIELWAHKLRSLLTLTLLMLGVFALVVMTSVLDGVMDRITTGFSGMSWDGTITLAPKSPQTTEEQKRFAMSPGLRFEDLPRLTAPHPSVLAFLPRAQKRSAVRVPGGSERLWIVGVTHDYGHWMNRPIGLGRGLTEGDEKRRSTVAVVGAGGRVIRTHGDYHLANLLYRHDGPQVAAAVPADRDPDGPPAGDQRGVRRLINRRSSRSPKCARMASGRYPQARRMRSTPTAGSMTCGR